MQSIKPNKIDMEKINDTFTAQTVFRQNMNFETPNKPWFEGVHKSKQYWFDENIIDPISKFLYAESEPTKQSWFENNVFNPTSKFLFDKLTNICRY